MQSSTRIAIVGASGGLGRALVRLYAAESSNKVFALSRSTVDFVENNVTNVKIDYEDEASISDAAEKVGLDPGLDIIVVATGILHDNNMMPEKSLKQLSLDGLQKNFLVNSIGPMLVAKYFTPLLNKNTPSVFAALSARVGSIEDNRLGGWYSYRASKAALNMLIKTTSVELARTNKNAIIVGLHPGTVATKLSEPFQARVPESKLFSTEFAAEKLVEVLSGLSSGDSGYIFAWDGQKIPY